VPDKLNKEFEPEFSDQDLVVLDEFAAHLAPLLKISPRDLLDEDHPAGLGAFPTSQSLAAEVQTVVQAIQAGSRLGPYRIVRLIARGGMGAVYEAEHTQLERRLALKIVKRGGENSLGTHERFRNEIRLAASINHPNIVSVYDAGEADGYGFLAMELLDGVNLFDLVRDYGPLPPAAAVALIAQVTSGLAEAHGHLLVHRDIKPSNIMLARNTGHRASCTTAKLLDLGLALHCGDATSNTCPRHTEIGTVVGTLDFMCPEQAAADFEPEPSWDVYSLGATLFFLMSGVSPLSSHRGNLAKLSALATGAFRNSREFKSLAKPYRRLVETLMSRDASTRPANAGYVLPLLRTLGDQAQLDCWLTSIAANLGMAPPAMKPANLETDGDARWSSSWTPTRIMSLGLILFGAAVMVSIASDSGEIRISTEGENVRVSIWRENQPFIEALTVDRKGKRLRLRSGNYRVLIEGTEDTEFVVHDGDVVLSRWSKHEVLISPARPAQKLNVAAVGVSAEARSAIEWLLAHEAEILLEGDEQPIQSIAQFDLSSRIQSLVIDLRTRPALPDLQTHLQALPTISDSVTFIGLLADVTELNSLLRAQAFTNVRWLRFEDCGIADPGNLEHFRNLQGISLAGTRLSEAGLASLAQLRGLRELNLANSRLTDAPLLHLDGSHLTAVRLDQNPDITDRGVLSLIQPSIVQVLSLEGTNITDSLFGSLAEAHKLANLNVAGTQISDLGLAHVCQLDRLESLCLSRTSVTHDGLSRLAKTHLRMLWLDDNPQIDDRSTAEIAMLSTLRFLSVVRTSITEDGVIAIAQLPELEELFLTGIHLGDIGLSQLSTMSSLRRLYLWDCGLTDAQIGRLKESLVDCEIIH
jgi:serine/threonine protein kinase